MLELLRIEEKRPSHSFGFIGTKIDVAVPNPLILFSYFIIGQTGLLGDLAGSDGVKRGKTETLVL